VDRANFDPLIDENQRAVKAVPAPVGGALHASQVDGDAVPGRSGAESIEMPGLWLNGLSRVFGKTVFCRAELNRAPSVNSSRNG